MKIKNGRKIGKLIWNDKEIIKRIKAGKIIYQKETPGPEPEPTMWCYNMDADYFNVMGGQQVLYPMSQAMLIPEELNSKKIVAVDLPLCGGNITNINLWFSFDIELYTENMPEFLYEQYVGNYNEGRNWLHVKLDVPVEIPEGEFYVGFTQNSDYNYPLGWYDMRSIDDTTFDNSWMKWWVDNNDRQGQSAIRIYYI